MQTLQLAPRIATESLPASLATAESTAGLENQILGNQILENQIEDRKVRASSCDQKGAADPHAVRCAERPEDASEDASFEIDASLEMDVPRGSGAFAGLRAAMLFNLGFAVAGLVAYELWTLMQPTV